MTIPGPTPAGPPPSGPLPDTTPIPQQPGTPPSLDTLNEAAILIGPDGQPLNLQPVQEDLSILAFAQAINEAIQELRESLNEAEFLDPLLLKDFRLNTIASTRVNQVLFDLVTIDEEGYEAIITNQNTVIDELNQALIDFNALATNIESQDAAQIGSINNLINAYNNVDLTNFTPEELDAFLDAVNQPNGWETILNDENGSITTLNSALASLDNDLSTLVSDDSDAIDAVNTAIDNYNNTDLNSLSAAQRQQLVDDTNDAINTYNTYVTARNSDLQQFYSIANSIVEQYNTQTVRYNAAVDFVNQLRALLNQAGSYPENLPLLSEFPTAPVDYPELSAVPLVTGSSSEQPVDNVQKPPAPGSASTSFSQATIATLTGDFITIGDFNNYVSARNSTFSTAVDNFNSQTLAVYNDQTGSYNPAIEIINRERQRLMDEGEIPQNDPYPEDLPIFPSLFDPALYDTTPFPLPTLPLLTGNDQPVGAVAAPTSTNNLLANIQDNITFIEGETEALEAAFIEAALEVLGLDDFLVSLLELAEAEIDRRRDLNQGLPIVFPAAFITNHYEAFLNASGPGGNAGLGSLVVGLDSNSLASTLGRSILDTISETSRFPLPPNIVDQLQFFQLNILSQNALLGVLPAVRLLGNRFAQLAGSNPAIAAVLGLTFTNRILDLIGSGSLRQGVNSLVTQAVFDARIARSLGLLPPGLDLFALGSAGQIAELTRNIAAGLGIALLGTSLSNLQLALGIPTLSLQLLGNIEGVPQLEILTALAAGSKIADVLRNPISQIFIKSTLANILINERGFTSALAARVVGSSIDNVLQRGLINNFFQLQEELIRQFKLQGLSGLLATRLSNEAIGQIRAEVEQRFLDFAFRDNFDREAAIREIVANSIREDRIQFEEILRDSIVRSIRENTFETQREFRNTLAFELRRDGIRRAEALAAANQVVNFAESGVIAPGTGISPEREERLRDTLRDRVRTDLGLNRRDADRLADEAVDRALSRGPFASEGEFLAVLQTQFLRNAVTRGIAAAAALNALARGAAGLGPEVGTIENLRDEVSARLINLLASDLGEEQARRLATSVSHTLFGAVSADEAAAIERRDPLSVLHQVREQVELLKEIQDEEVLKRTSTFFREVIHTTAEQTFVLNEVFRPAEAFFGSLAAGAGEGKRSIMFMQGV